MFFKLGLRNRVINYNQLLQFDQATYVCEYYGNCQDSKPIFIINDFKIFAKLLLRQLNFGVHSFFVRTYFIRTSKLRLGKKRTN